MMKDWFSPPKSLRRKPGWPVRIGLTLLAIWAGMYLFVGKEAFTTVGVIAIIGIVLSSLVFALLLNLIDPRLRARWLSWRAQRKHGRRT